MFKYKQQAKLYILTSVILLVSVLMYQSCQSFLNRISLLENRVKALEFVSFNK